MKLNVLDVFAILCLVAIFAFGLLILLGSWTWATRLLAALALLHALVLAWSEGKAVQLLAVAVLLCRKARACFRGGPGAGPA